MMAYPGTLPVAELAWEAHHQGVETRKGPLVLPHVGPWRKHPPRRIHQSVMPSAPPTDISPASMPSHSPVTTRSCHAPHGLPVFEIYCTIKQYKKRPFSFFYQISLKKWSSELDTILSLWLYYISVEARYVSVGSPATPEAGRKDRGK